MRKNIMLVLGGVILCSVVIGGVMIWRAMDVPTEHRRTDDAIASMDKLLDQSEQVREVIRTETVVKVVTIRDEVQKKVDSLHADDLAAFALNEIVLFRGERSGDRVTAYSAGMDDAGGRILLE